MEENVNYVGLCLSEIEQQLGWGESSTWTQQDFEEASERMYDATGVKLSVTTLKRIWGKVSYTSSPTIHTLNALAKFAGYESWRDFKLNHTPAEETIDAEIQQSATPMLVQPPLQPIAHKRKAGISRMYSVIIPVLLAVVGLVFYKLTFKPLLLNESAITFSSQPVTQGLPNTVIFNYDASASPSDDIAIQQSWDERMREKVSKDNHQYTTTYYYPGYHRAKLLINDQVIKEHDVYLKTKGWLALVENEPIPLYIKENIIAKGVMQASLASLNKYKLTSANEFPWVDYYNVQDFGELPSNDFSFETEIKNEYNIGNAVCQESRISIMCSNGRLLIPLAIPGCVGNINLHLGDLYLEGRKNDLSAFGCDLSQWQKLRCEVQNRQISIFLNDKKIYETAYTYNAGKVVGIRYKFMGAGTVNYIRLWNKDKKVVFEDDFN